MLSSAQQFHLLYAHSNVVPIIWKSIGEIVEEASFHENFLTSPLSAQKISGNLERRNLSREDQFGVVWKMCYKWKFTFFFVRKVLWGFVVRNSQFEVLFSGFINFYKVNVEFSQFAWIEKLAKEQSFDLFLHKVLKN